MSTAILRTADAWWVRIGDHVARIKTAATTTRELLADRSAIAAAASAGAETPIDSLHLLSPVTSPCRVVAQMTNFASHASDAGVKPSTVPLTFFRKSSGSISGPGQDIIKPSHVSLLDYEAEVGVVFGRTVPVGTQIGADNLAEYVAGLVITNDVSARDVQLPKTQFFESKSYPTFTPVGPALVLLDSDELKRFDDLRLQLWVDGKLRQNTRIGDDIIYRPLDALKSLTRFQHLDAGDLLLTGTPVGTALSAPPAIVQKVAGLLPEKRKWQIFLAKQAKNPRYLQDGDLVEISVASEDGTIDLGTQHTTVRYAR
ncbi:MULTISPECIES: fumarylacetoacetate hydrolase family protein [Nocardioides]|uniref:Fumarylacetoacetate hydrolase family protein n=1 Tax=Nocardioides vastitatis TaxID=2568655 RepID=A0ABW0ZCY7_9ACTN|nr:fumarylacetoacetate hydrolase family protein [Nocardioides sp.]THJ08610.1 fumarylacetoacetate hydrolase family protein [Nocardioides sp.]